MKVIPITALLLSLVACSHSQKSTFKMTYTSSVQEELQELKVTTDEELKDDVIYASDLSSFINCQKINNRFPRLQKRIVVPENGTAINEVRSFYSCDLDTKAEASTGNMLRHFCRQKDTHSDVNQLCQTAMPYLVTH